MNEPQEIAIHPEEVTVDKITQELYHVSKDEKFGLFLQVMTKENPESCLIFTNTKARCIEVAKRLTLNGFPTSYLMGDMPQAKRLATIDRMKEGKIKYLVATDVAARGLQIDDLPMVVNYDIPEDYESYVHRIGRTARAGKSGKAITFADEEYVYGLEAIENFIKMKIPVICRKTVIFPPWWTRPRDAFP
jgi:ATP-dependent RNA helicase RhlB